MDGERKSIINVPAHCGDKCDKKFHEAHLNKPVCHCEACFHRLELTSADSTQHKMHIKGWELLREVTSGQRKDSDSCGKDSDIAEKRDVFMKLTEYDPHLLFLRIEHSLQQYICHKKAQLLKMLAKGYECPTSALDIAKTMLEMFSNVIEIATDLSTVLNKMETHHLPKFGTTWLKWSKCQFQSVVYGEPTIHQALPELTVQLRKGITKEPVNLDILHRFLKFGDEMRQIHTEWEVTRALITEYTKQYAAAMENFKLLHHGLFHHGDRPISTHECLRQNATRCHPIDSIQNNPMLSNLAPFLTIPNFPLFSDASYGPWNFDSPVEVYNTDGDASNVTSSPFPLFNKNMYDIKVHPPSVPSDDSMLSLSSDEEVEPKFIKHGLNRFVSTDLIERSEAVNSCEDTGHINGGDSETLDLCIGGGEPFDAQKQILRYQCHIPYTIPTTLFTSPLITGSPSMLHKQQNCIHQNCNGDVGDKNNEGEEYGDADDEAEEGGVRRCGCNQCLMSSAKSLRLSSENVSSLSCDGGFHASINYPAISQTTFTLTDHHGLQHLYNHESRVFTNTNASQWTPMAASVDTKGDAQILSDSPSAANLFSSNHEIPPLLLGSQVTRSHYGLMHANLSQNSSFNFDGVLQPPFPSRVLPANGYMIPGLSTEGLPAANDFHANSSFILNAKPPPLLTGPIVTCTQQQSSPPTLLNANCQGTTGSVVTDGKTTTATPTSTSYQFQHRKKLVAHGKLARQQVLQKKAATGNNSTRQHNLSTVAPIPSATLPEFQLSHGKDAEANNTGNLEASSSEVKMQVPAPFKYESSSNQNKASSQQSSVDASTKQSCLHNSSNGGETLSNGPSTAQNSTPAICAASSTTQDSQNTSKTKHTHTHSHQQSGSGEPTSCCNEGDDCSSDTASNGMLGGSSLTGSSKYCDCCYCEFFGNGGPPLAPTSKNYPEMRERLRSKLSRKHRTENKGAQHNSHHHDERSLDEILSFIEGEGNVLTENNKKNLKKARQKLQRDEERRRKEKETALARLHEEKCQTGNIENPASSSKQALNKKRKTKKKQASSEENMTVFNSTPVEDKTIKIKFQNDQKLIGNVNIMQQVNSDRPNHSRQKTNSSPLVERTKRDGSSSQANETPKHNNNKNKVISTQKTNVQAKSQNDGNTKEKTPPKSEGKGNKKTQKQNQSSGQKKPAEDDEVVHVDQVFMPKGDNLASNEMDDIEKEIDSFKRFCLDSTSYVRKQKISVNWKDFSFKKNHIQH